MLPRSRRLSVKQFDMVMKEGRVFNSPFFLARILGIENTDNSSVKQTRLSAVAPIKIAKKASARNAVRRFVYQAVEPLMSRLKDNSSVILIAKSAVLGADAETVNKDIEKIFVKAGLLS